MNTSLHELLAAGRGAEALADRALRGELLDLDAFPAGCTEPRCGEQILCWLDLLAADRDDQSDADPSEADPRDAGRDADRDADRDAEPSLAGAERAALAAHLAECPACAAEVSDARAALAEFGQAGEGLERAAPRIGLRCTYCHDGLLAREAAYCAECLSVHHPECFLEHGRCTALGCASERWVRSAPAGHTAAPAPATGAGRFDLLRRIRWSLTGAAGLALAGGLAAWAPWITPPPDGLYGRPALAEAKTPSYMSFEDARGQILALLQESKARRAERCEREGYREFVAAIEAARAAARSQQEIAAIERWWAELEEWVQADVEAARELLREAEPVAYARARALFGRVPAGSKQARVAQDALAWLTCETWRRDDPDSLLLRELRVADAWRRAEDDLRDEQGGLSLRLGLDRLLETLRAAEARPLRARVIERLDEVGLQVLRLAREQPVEDWALPPWLSEARGAQRGWAWEAQGAWICAQLAEAEFGAGLFPRAEFLAAEALVLVKRVQQTTPSREDLSGLAAFGADLEARRLDWRSVADALAKAEEHRQSGRLEEALEQLEFACIRAPRGSALARRTGQERDLLPLPFEARAEAAYAAGDARRAFQFLFDAFQRAKAPEAIERIRGIHEHWSRVVRAYDRGVELKYLDKLKEAQREFGLVLEEEPNPLNQFRVRAAAEIQNVMTCETSTYPSAEANLRDALEKHNWGMFHLMAHRVTKNGAPGKVQEIGRTVQATNQRLKLYKTADRAFQRDQEEEFVESARVLTVLANWLPESDPQRAQAAELLKKINERIRRWVELREDDDILGEPGQPGDQR